MQTSIVDILKKYRELIQQQSIIDRDIDNLRKQRSAIAEELNDIERKLAELEKTKTKTLTTDDIPTTSASNGVGTIPEGYNSRYPNIKKAAFVLKEKKQCLPIRAIVDRILVIENSVDNKEEDRRLVGSLSSTLSTKAKKHHHVSRYQEFEGGEWLYGLNDWFDEDWKPLKEFERVL